VTIRTGKTALGQPRDAVRPATATHHICECDAERYDFGMKKSLADLDKLLEPLSDCLTEESARRVIALKPDRRLQSVVDKLSEKSSAGTLSEEERETYRRYVSYGTFIATLKSKARLLLSRSRNP
jgi:hypothetical protein